MSKKAAACKAMAPLGTIGCTIAGNQYKLAHVIPIDIVSANISYNHSQRSTDTGH